MKITRKSDYGLRAMYELTKSYGRSPISITEIAMAQGIPDPFLEKIMQELKSAGLIAATHGRSGGYSLDRAPSRISVREVIEALEGPVALVTCLDPSLKCLIEDGCPTSGFWMLINERFEEALGATTLADLLASARTPPHATRKVPEESGSSQ